MRSNTPTVLRRICDRKLEEIAERKAGPGLDVVKVTVSESAEAARRLDCKETTGREVSGRSRSLKLICTRCPMIMLEGSCDSQCVGTGDPMKG